MLRAIVIIVIDCLRADHVSAYGYHRPTTPAIEALAKRGVLWEQAYSASSWTKPSVTSILTGLYPTEHGAFEGIKRGKATPRVTTDALKSRQPTLAESLTEHGWRCGAFINNAQLGTFSSLDRGFQAYLPTAGKADRLIESFRAWLASDGSQPVFAYLHFLEAHWPYKPRRRHVRLFGGDRDTNLYRDFSARDFGKLRRAVSHGDAQLDGECLEQLTQMYDAAVRRLDGKVKMVLGVLNELGRRDDVAIVVTADHGEEFLDHGRIGHGQSLFEELIHVPLVALFPGCPVGQRVTAPVSQVDLTPTLLHLAGIHGPHDARSLLNENRDRQPVFAELKIKNKYAQIIRQGRWKLHRRFVFRPTDGGLDQGGTPFDWVWTCSHDIIEELYDLRIDPEERCDLSNNAECAGVLDDLRDRLDCWWQAVSARSHHDTDVEIDEAVVRRLQDLGYID